MSRSCLCWGNTGSFEAWRGPPFPEQLIKVFSPSSTDSSSTNSFLMEGVPPDSPSCSLALPTPVPTPKANLTKRGTFFTVTQGEGGYNEARVPCCQEVHLCGVRVPWVDFQILCLETPSPAPPLPSKLPHHLPEGEQWKTPQQGLNAGGRGNPGTVGEEVKRLSHRREGQKPPPPSEVDKDSHPGTEPRRCRRDQSGLLQCCV